METVLQTLFFIRRPGKMVGIEAILKEHFNVISIKSRELLFASTINPEKIPAAYVIDVGMSSADPAVIVPLIRANNKLAFVPVMLLADEETGEDAASIHLKLDLVDYAVITPDYNFNFLIRRIDAIVIAAEKMKKANDNVYATLEKLSSSFTGLRDISTYNHSERTKKFMRVLLDNLTAEIIEANPPAALWNKEIVSLAAQLHDMGKISTHNCLLEKSGKLSDPERGMMQSHVEEGAKMLQKLSMGENDPEMHMFLVIASNIAAYHHCYYAPNPKVKINNNYGYPEVKSGNEIPLEARLMTVVDTYDALRFKRHYKDKMSHDSVCNIIINDIDRDTREKRGQFDPAIVKIFEAHKNKFKKISNDALKKLGK